MQKLCFDALQPMSDAMRLALATYEAISGTYREGTVDDLLAFLREEGGDNLVAEFEPRMIFSNQDAAAAPRQ